MRQFIKTLTLGLASSAGMALGIMQLSAATVYVGYEGGIRQFDLAGNGSVFAHAAPGAQGAPTDLAADREGNLYASYYYFWGAPGSGTTAAIIKYDTAGNSSLFADVGADLGQSSGAANPNGLAFDYSGNLYVACHSGDGPILRYGVGAGGGTVFATGTWGRGLAFDQAGNLFAPGGDYILEFDPAGNSSVFATVGDGHLLAGDAFDSEGFLYAADPAFQTVWRFDQVGNPSVFGSGVDAYFLAFDGNDNLYVMSRDNPPGQVLKFDELGNRSVFADGLA